MCNIICIQQYKLPVSLPTFYFPECPFGWCQHCTALTHGSVYAGESVIIRLRRLKHQCDILFKAQLMWHSSAKKKKKVFYCEEMHCGWWSMSWKDAWLLDKYFVLHYMPSFVFAFVTMLIIVIVAQCNPFAKSVTAFTVNHHTDTHKHANTHLHTNTDHAMLECLDLFFFLIVAIKLYESSV